ncbi:MAG: hypothetical protein ACOC32_02625 [Nanoarchaeota archaeon]
MNKTSLRFFVILLAVIGVGLLFMIGTHMVSIYRGSIKEVDTEEESRNVECYQMSFYVELKSDDILEVTNRDLSSFDLEELTFTDAETGETMSKPFSFFLPGDTRDVKIDDVPFDVFYVYPFDCDSVARICNRTSQSCRELKRYNE